MLRRDFLRVSGAVVLAAAVRPCFGVSQGQASGKPNIVYILADDMGYGDVTALNPESRIPTPHLDRLANEGMAFTQAYTGSSICTPTRYGIMTGRYCWRESVGLASGYSEPKIAPSLPTVAGFLRDNGYGTHIVGKWHLGGQWISKDGQPVRGRPKIETVDFARGITGGPVDRGFDTWFGVIASLDMPPYVYIRDRKPVVIPTKDYPEKNQFGRAGAADENLTSVQVLGDLTDETVKVIKAQKAANPFFLYMPLTAPHSPVVPTKEWQGKCIDKNADFRMQVDHCVGRVLTALDEQELAYNTMVIFTADNGSAKHHYLSMLRLRHDSSDRRRGHKASLYEGGHRVAFLVRWPARVKAGSRDAGMISLEDFFATCTAILGKELPDEAVDSVSFLPQLLGEKQKSGQRTLIMSSLGNKLVLRHEQWKLICVDEPYATAGLGELQADGKEVKRTKEKVKYKDDPSLPWHERIILYDLKTDFAETTNVAEQHPVIVAKMAKLAIKSIRGGRTNIGPARPDSCQTPSIDLLEDLAAITPG